MRVDQAPVAGRVMPTITHQRPPLGNVRLDSAAGWHTHLDILCARLQADPAAPFWAAFPDRRTEYRSRLQQQAGTPPEPIIDHAHPSGRNP